MIHSNGRGPSRKGILTIPLQELLSTRRNFVILIVCLEFCSSTLSIINNDFINSEDFGEGRDRCRRLPMRPFKMAPPGIALAGAPNSNIGYSASWQHNTFKLRFMMLQFNPTLCINVWIHLLPERKWDFVLAQIILEMSRPAKPRFRHKVTATQPKRCVWSAFWSRLSLVTLNLSKPLHFLLTANSSLAGHLVLVSFFDGFCALWANRN